MGYHPASLGFVAKKRKPGTPELHTPHARALLVIQGSSEPVTYEELGAHLDLHERSAKRIVDDMVDAGWITTERKPHHLEFHINPNAKVSDGTTLGDWLNKHT